MSIHGRFLIVIFVAAALPLAACKVYDPLYCDEKTECTNPDRPFCDLEGEFPGSEGVPRTCIADPNPQTDAGPEDSDAGNGDDFCTAGEFVQCTDEDTALYCDDQGSEYISLDCDLICDAKKRGCFCEPSTSVCSGGKAVYCGGDGHVEEVETCALGCDDTGVRCIDVEPSNGLGGYLDMSDDAPAVTLSNGAEINTDEATIENGDGSLLEVPTFQITAPPGGVTIRVFVVKSLIVGDVTIVGSRALAIVSDGDIGIGGHVRILAGASKDGACVGSFGLFEICNTGGWCGAYGGGGGGGFGRRGAAGGNATNSDGNGSGGSGGDTIGDSRLVPLHGGCAGGGTSDGSPIGGPGGGALQLVSRTQIRIEDGTGEAILNAGGKAAQSINDGGGSGGGILLEAPRVVFASGGWRAVANGGGGGSACGDPDPQDGSLTSTGAPGGGVGCTNPLFGVGGSGGARLEAKEGGDATTPDRILVMGGGGGGAVGRIRVNVPAPSDFKGTSSSSPPASVGTLSTR